jgi:hypothetical protein
MYKKQELGIKNQNVYCIAFHASSNPRLKLHHKKVDLFFKRNIVECGQMIVSKQPNFDFYSI